MLYDNCVVGWGGQRGAIGHFDEEDSFSAYMETLIGHKSPMWFFGFVPSTL